VKFVKLLSAENPRAQSLLLCLLTFLIGVGLIAAHLRWDIPAEVAKVRTKKGAPVKGSAPPPAVPGAAPTQLDRPVPVPVPPADESKERDALLNRAEAAFTQLSTLEGDILRPDQAGQSESVGHFIFSKTAGQDLGASDHSKMLLRVSFTAVPATEVLVSKGIVHVYHPTRRTAVTKDLEKAVEDWLKDYMELSTNIDLKLLDKGSLGANRPAELEILPRQPKNIKKATIFFDLRNHLPVRFGVDLPLKKISVTLANLKAGQPPDPKSFVLKLPAGMKWAAQ
jgi:hypothetical protein